MRVDQPYQPPVVTSEIDLDLSRNEGRPLDPSILAGIAGRPGIFNRYPDSTGLRDRIASIHGIDPGRVLVTAGGDDALLRCCSALIGPRAVATTPTFEMVPRYATLRGAELVEISWKGEPFPTSSMLAAARPGTVCLIVSPNNPTGEVLGPQDLIDLAGSFDDVILDCAYTEFADNDLTTTALTLDNVITIRTLSKAWGLAGLRVGYLLGSAGVVRFVSAHGNPYPVSRLSLAIAEERVASDDVSSFVGRIRLERECLTRLLGSAGLKPIRSQANFVFVETPSAPRLHQELAGMGIAVRRFPDRAGLEDALRITLPGDATEYARLERSLLTALQREKEPTS